MFEDETFEPGDLVGTEEMAKEMFHRRAVQIRSGKISFEKKPSRMHLMALKPSEDPREDFLETIDLGNVSGEQDTGLRRGRYN